MPWKYPRISRRRTRDTLCPVERENYHCAAAQKRAAACFWKRKVRRKHPTDFFLFAFEVLNLRVFSKIRQNVADEGDSQENCVHCRNDTYYRVIHKGEQHQRDQADKQDGGADLSGHQCAG